LSTFSLRLTTGPEQKIRAAWNVVTNLGVDQAVYFSDFDLEDSKWSTPDELDRKIDDPDYFGPSFPAIADNGQDIVVLYNSGNPYSDQFVPPGRPIMQVASSRDGGVTWSGPFGPFPLLNGRSGEHSLAVDGTGAMHGVFIMRIDQVIDGRYKSIGGIWHSQYKDGIWTNPDRLITTVAPHDVHAVVSQGNVLLLVWRQDPGGGQSGIWYSYKVLDVPETNVVPLSGEPVNHSSQDIVTPPPVIATTELPIETDVLRKNPPSNLGKNPALPVIISSLIVVIILAGVFWGYRLNTTRK
jgi:hypothetical protein